jgi:enterochelin esterase-like enzyme
MRSIALDIGNQDPFVGTNTQLGESLTRLGVTHTFEVYDGDHGNRIRERFESQVLRFFSQHLSAR